jgi:hypothetical protein
MLSARGTAHIRDLRSAPSTSNNGAGPDDIVWAVTNRPIHSS